ncbi:polysaccharide biosynthesis tyrosine autokinase [Nocardioides dongxiaopingii]|uniref:polysaccharide biosynthesis tyrosine autokinase n=1 Tax=Nocardioides dongxiaopingii TaxID=2576036 RepID=UPI0010C76C2A|nr:polysaccharide biosynthesis tyrosine autokinase [Nocardioides dongxiaopingii]
MTLLGFVQLLRKRWVTVLVLVVVGVALAFALTSALPKEYEAEGKTFVSITTNADDPTAVLQSTQYANQRVKSYTLLIDSPGVLDGVIDDLGLDSTTRQLSKRVSLENPLDTTILVVRARDGDPEVAADIANAVSTELATLIESLETPPGGGMSSVRATLTTPATAPGNPVSPNRTINLALGLLLGLSVGVTVAMMREFLDTTVRTSDAVVDLTGQVPLAAVPVDPDARKSAPLALDTTSPLLESFRTLRSNLRFSNVDNPPRTMVVCSALSSEGKSTTAQNLAIALAQSGFRVCLLDADLRRPSIARNLGIEGAVGLTNVLIGEASLKDALTSWHHGLLHVLPAGTVPSDPPTLLGSEHMRSLLVDLREIFDYVIIDAPPIIHVSDAAVLADAADGALLVIRAGRSRRDQVATSLDVLHTVGARVIGTVLTFAPASGGYGYGVPVEAESLAGEPTAVTEAAIAEVSDRRQAAERARELARDQAVPPAPDPESEPERRSDSARPSRPATARPRAGATARKAPVPRKSPKR